MNDRELRKALAELGLPRRRRVSAQELATALAAHRGRPLHLRAVDFPPKANGGVVRTRKFDLLCYPKNGWPIERRNAFAHEISHLLLDHTGVSLHSQDVLRSLLAPNIAPEVASRLLCRTEMDTPEEQDAETTGMHLARHHLTYELPDRAWGATPEQQGVVRGLLHSLNLNEVL
ncbi:hypothetical protein [Amycolatopsis anabasis]|uniref:hypothetical protein n=1 Tax=Amycolatopsis anabasis TaxID=1840409 RepID=UPI00131A796D|nr:hypothetical protein [Amycolatopsis anabasis]